MTALATSPSMMVERLAHAYQPNSSALSITRILFAMHLLLFPTDYSWVAQVPARFFNPPPGPFALLENPPAAGLVATLEVVRAVLSVALLIGVGTLPVSVALSAVLIVGAGLTHSFGKVDHFILYELFPVFMGFAGWGARFSFDAHAKSAGRTSGYAILLWAITVGYALFSAAVPKMLTGWLDPARQATRGYLSLDVADPVKQGILSDWMFSIKAPAFWKLVDYATVFAEGWLLFVVVAPLFFRVGVLILLGFHAGVMLTLGIDFASYLFVYSVFFFAPPRDLLRWHGVQSSQARLARTPSLRRSE
ncbi:hypothetical protein [Arthrobacter sp. B1805]|uniref:hypothetical protein n=1 Tax=Arthrobacter sp. B1805 TaxID=2058892 RepID=UPI000CE48764|nr:hypothetical protein [Arthrobacter sp. B1805]